MRSVLEETSLADSRPVICRLMATFADDYRGQEQERGHRTVGSCDPAAATFGVVTVLLQVGR